ncbi:MAG: sugar transferase [Candidatus Melainabacteria bacterium]|nr:sugar transferase [Candidatus Melainabacteria bacterium]
MNLVLKRIMDILLSLIGIIFLLPVWIIISTFIKLDSKGPIFYVHKRIGKSGKEFNCIKFRSMHVNSNPHKLVDNELDSRVTKVGYFLRKTSLDETVQLVNVLLGDMAIVGPRPSLPSQVREFKKNDYDKLLVKPGLTGWTQVNGRNSIPYKKRLELDSWYAKNWNILLDLKILLKTIFVVFKQEGIYDVK